MSRVKKNSLEVLRHILLTKPEALDNCQQMKALLNDYLFPSDKEAYYLLSIILEYGIPQRLKSLKCLSAQSLSCMVRQLEQERCIEFHRALDGVLTWAYGLEIDLSEVEQLAILEQPRQEYEGSKHPLAKGTKPTKHQIKILRKHQLGKKMQKAIVSLINQTKDDPQANASEAGEPTISLSADWQNGEVCALKLPQGLSLNLVWCPKGTFMMGSPSTEDGRLEDEEQHEVTLSNGFWIGQYPVTQEQYNAVLPGYLHEVSHPRCPVVGVTWEDAREFCHQVINKTNSLPDSSYLVTLPTEAQWEYACRAGTTSALHNGLELNCKDGASANLAQVGWYWENSGREAHEVGQKSPNAWALYDMQGNVWEWCLDRYGSYVSQAIDSRELKGGICRVVRGGSFLSEAFRCRSASRNCYSSSYHSLALGFRVVVSQDPSIMPNSRE